MHRIAVIENYISHVDADLLVKEMNNPSEINPYPEYYKKRYGGTAFPYNKTVMDLLVKYGKKSNVTMAGLNGYVNPIYVFKAFGSHWTEGTKGDLHIDAQGPEPFIEWSTIMYLSEPSEYGGGEIYFPNQNFSIKPKKCSAVMFPSAGTEYIHGVNEITSGHRYTALFMHTSQKPFADPDFLK